MGTQQQDIKINITAQTTKATNQVKKLNAQIKQLEKESAKTNKSLKSSNNAIQKVGASFKQLSAHLARLVVIYGSFNAMISTVKVYANFEQAIKTLGLVSNATGEELQALEAKAKELGESTVFSASQVAEAMTEMARAGLSAQEQLDAIDGVLNLSINGMVSLAEASKIATTAMNGFGLEASDISNISDVLSKATNSYATTLSELGEGMAKVAPVARSMGVSFEETTALLGLLADAGRRGAEAGTQLKIVMLRLGANVEARKWIKDLGVDMYNNNGTLKTFTEQLQAIQDGMVGLTQKQQLLAKARIFGSEALASAEILLENLEKIDPAVVALQNSFGYAQDNATEMMNTLQGSYKELLSALEGLQLEVGKNLAPALRDVIDNATEFVRSLDKDAIEQFTDDLASMIGVLGDVYDGFEKLISIGVTVTKAITGIASTETLAKFALGALALYKFRTAILAVSTAIGLLKPALTGLKLAGFASGFKALIPALSGSVSKLKLFGAGVLAVGSSLKNFGVLLLASQSKMKLLGAGLMALRTQMVSLTASSWLLAGGLGALAIPILAIVAAGVGIGYVFNRMQTDIDNLNTATKDFDNSLIDLNKVFEETYTNLENLSENDTRKALLQIGVGAKKAEKQLRAMGDELQALEDKKIENDYWFLPSAINEWEKQRIKTLNQNITTIATTLDNVRNKATEVLKKHGQELRNATQEGLRLNALEKNSRYALSEGAIALEKEQLKAVEKTTKGYEKRLKTLKSTLKTMEKSEKGLVKDLKKLEQDLADTRKRHATERLSQSHKFKSALADIAANNLDDLGKYNDAQLRADEALSKSKKALAEGNLQMANEYHAEYMRLISVNATSEIKIGDDVKRTKKQNIAELLADTKAGNAIATQLLLEKQRIEEEAIQKNIALKLNELELFRVQMKLQVQLVKLMSEMAGNSKGLMFDDQLKQFNAEALETEKIIDRIVGEQKTLIMDIETSKLTGKIDEVKTKIATINNPKINTTEAVKEVEKVKVAFDGVKATLTDEQMIKVKADKAELDLLNEQLRQMMLADKELIISADPSKAKADFNELQAKAEQLENEIETQMSVNVDATQATAKFQEIANEAEDLSYVEMSVEADTTKATSEIQKVVDKTNELDDTIIVVDADVSPAIGAIQEVVDVTNNLDDTTIVVDADTTKATSELDALVKKGNSAKIIPKVSLNTRQADSTMRAKERLWSKPITKIIRLRYQGKQKLQDGGMVLPRFADGGHLDNGIGHTRKSNSLGGYGGGDKIKALLEAGEFIIKKESVRKLGLDRLHMINQGRLPRFQDGGAVKIPRYNTGGSVSSESSSGSVVELNLNLGGETFKMMTDSDVASALERYTRENL